MKVMAMHDLWHRLARLQERVHARVTEMLNTTAEIDRLAWFGHRPQ
jgi:hypothetical protein